MRPRLSRDLLVYGVGEVVVKAFGLITIPVYTRVFSPDEYGALSVVLTLGGLFIAVVALGGDSAFVRYFLAARTLEERRVVTTTWIGFLGVWALLAAVGLIPFAGSIAELAIGPRGDGVMVAIALLLTPIRLINMMCAQVLRNEFRAVAFTVLNVAALGLMVALSIGAAVGLDLGIRGVLIGTLVAEAAMLPVRLITARHMIGTRVSRRTLGTLLAYGIPLVPASLAYWVFMTSDRVLLANLSTLAQVGLFSVATSLVNLTQIAVTALGQAWSPHAVHAYEEDRDGAAQLFGRMMTYVLGAFGLLAVGITAFAPALVDLLTGDEYTAAASAVGPLAIGMVAYASTQVTAGGITLTGRTAYLALLSWVAAIINVVLNLLLIPPFGMLGAAWASAAAYVGLTLAYAATSQRLWPVAYEARRGLFLAGLTLAFVVGASLLPGSTSGGALAALADLGLRAAYCLAFVAALFASRALDGREVAVLRGFVARAPRSSAP
ncbi:MAG: oligosaccharide flippase family protein [Candidatus Limnocylindria bacterium]